MSRSGYSDDIDNWQLIKWRGAVASASRGKRGQSFFLELIAALDALPEKKLIAHDLEAEGAVCALGAVGKRRGTDMSKVDPEDRDSVAGLFNLPHALTCEVVYMNDEWGPANETPEARWSRIRAWAVANLRDFEPAPIVRRNET
jgi:hypothetical protein